ncbi:hypothetical protein AB2L27_04910 [Kineococcus sp. LSe6-4]|uniref:DUF2530 domain-containing protein n=1 Tax=Kineococcus halophytocola TaxID=3234027 RepID=A0ABV4GZS4_9ACTN
MTPRRPQRLVPVLGLSTGTVLVLTCLTAHLLSRQPPTSAFRVLWALVGLGGVVLAVLSARLLRVGRRTDGG